VPTPQKIHKKDDVILSGSLTAAKNPLLRRCHPERSAPQSRDRKTQGCDIILPLEKTFYGATHFFIREPGGHVLGLSENE
jgi:hypothetical protein